VTGEERVFELLSKLETEQRNPASERLSEMETIEILRVINEEDKKVAYAVEKALPEIAKLVDTIVEAVRSGGRWIYVGAGTSGRLAAIDVAELLSTYDVGPEVVEALVAGGPGAMVRPIEGAEDDEEMAVRELKARRVCGKDVVVGISASGRTPYVVSALKYAKSVGARTAAITCVENSPVTEFADIKVVVKTGPEVITGSTRMKAGTAQKMVLTMLSTAGHGEAGEGVREPYGCAPACQPEAEGEGEEDNHDGGQASATMKLPGSWKRLSTMW
jgi:N-acetylmuramic acid 6-phosphate etherase